MAKNGGGTDMFLRCYKFFKYYDIYDKDFNSCGTMGTYNGDCTYFDLLINIKGYNYHIVYIAEDKHLSISYYKDKATVFHHWTTDQLLKYVDLCIREKLRALVEELGRLDATFEPFVICRDILVPYLKRESL